MGSSQSFVDMLTQESAGLEGLPQATILDSGSNRGRGGNYNHNEDIHLGWSWIAITFDPRIGIDQSKALIGRPKLCSRTRSSDVIISLVSLFFFLLY